ncbi:MAG: dienelactone hydrolase family protein [Thermoleophilia bacterium]|nr:dienelactone hydrolase family protein [Thermoleophilia bacterium]
MPSDRSQAAGGPGGPGGRVFFSGDDRLEGIVEWPVPGVRPVSAGSEPAGSSTTLPANVLGGVVVAHPHSLNGGTMAQPVVYRVAQSCRQRGLATLRFNFRGVGASGGRFSGTEEYRDVKAAAAFLGDRLAALDESAAPQSRPRPLGLAGYSFGSVMAARAAAGIGAVRALALVGFVVNWGELPADTFERLAGFRGPVLAVCAENDDLGYPDEVEEALKELGLDFHMSVVEGAGHFLEGRHRDVGERVAAFLSEALGPERSDG